MYNIILQKLSRSDSYVRILLFLFFMVVETEMFGVFYLICTLKDSCLIRSNADGFLD